MRSSRSLLAAALALAMLPGGATAVASEAAPVQKPKPVPTPERTRPSTAIIDDQLVIGGEDIGARKVNTRMTVEVQVNGRGPYRFLVDSGADTSVVGLKMVRDLELPVGPPVILHGMTASAEVGRVKVAELGIGSSRFRDLLLPALRDEDLGGAGMVGIDALVQQRLMMDFEKRVIKVEDARERPRYENGEIIITARRRKGQLILTQVRAAGLPLEAVVDTGSEITIGNLALRDRLIKNNRDKFMTVLATGVTGATMEMQVARVSELRLGSVTLRDVPVAFADVPPFRLFGMSRQPALLLGTDLLETFRRVSLDFRARKVRFQLRRCGSVSVQIPTVQTTWLSRIATDNADVCRR